MIYILSEQKVANAKNLPIFKIKTVDFRIDFKDFDALVVTSKNAIDALEWCAPAYKKLPLYAIAPQTAHVALKYGASVEFVGKNGHGDAFAHELLTKLIGKRVLYARGEKVVSNLEAILASHEICLTSVVVYKTECITLDQKPQLPKGASIIFSAPSTIECFLKNFNWDTSYKAIAIGHTTAKYFPSHIIPYIAEATSLESCVQKAMELNLN